LFGMIPEQIARLKEENAKLKAELATVIREAVWAMEHIKQMPYPQPKGVPERVIMFLLENPLVTQWRKEQEGKG